jgi:hypothetical protein
MPSSKDINTNINTANRFIHPLSNTENDIKKYLMLLEIFKKKKTWDNTYFCKPFLRYM